MSLVRAGTGRKGVRDGPGSPPAAGSSRWSDARLASAPGRAARRSAAARRRESRRRPDPGRGPPARGSRTTRSRRRARSLAGRFRRPRRLPRQRRSPRERARRRSPPSGASLGSLHPLRVFTGDAPDETWNGSLVALEGESRRRRGGEDRPGDRRSPANRITASAKPLYHAGAALAAGGTAALIALATRAWSEAGIPEARGPPGPGRASPQAAAAAAARAHSRRSFTGPIARRDVGTVALTPQRSDQPALSILYGPRREILARRPAAAGRRIRALLRRKQGREAEILIGPAALAAVTSRVSRISRYNDPAPPAGGA